MFKRVWIFVVSLVFAGAPAIWGQAETGQITGTVLDQTGASIPNATVTATNVGTNAVRETTSNAAGAYTLANLLPGTYDVMIAASGFNTFKQRVEVTVGGKIGLDVHMEVGSAATTVQVEATAVQVNTETQTLGGVINTRAVTELPSQTRNPYDFVATLPNVSPADPGGNGVGYAINGIRSAGTNVLLDGVPNNDEFSATVGQQVPLDSVQEYSVLTSNFTAEFGRADAGIVNVVTKSGSNEFHGTAYEFNRVSGLASNSFYNNANLLPQGIYTRNQFGYSIGGPIVKNKLFFFENTEWIRVRSGQNEVAWVPTPQLIAAAAPATQEFFQTYGKLRTGLNTLSTYTKDDMVAAGVNVCGGAAAAGPCKTLPGSTPMFTRVSYTNPGDAGGGLPENTYDLVARVDYNYSDKTQMYVRYALYHENDFLGTVNTSPYAGFDTGQTNVDNAFIYSVTHTFSPTFISQTKFDYNRLNLQQPLGANPVSPTLYMSASTAVSFLGSLIAFPGYNEYTPGSAIPFGGPQNFGTITQDFSKMIGKHSIRFGGQQTYIQDNRAFGAYEEAVQGLGTAFGNEIDNFLLGQIHQFQAAINPQGKYPGQTVTLPVGPPSFSRSNRYNESALYVQDTYKITPRLTLNAGLRWEYFGIQHNVNPALDSNYYDGSGANIFQQIRSGAVYIANQSPAGSLWRPDYTDFGPRIGIAWDVFGDGKTSLRGGYGIGYERNFGNVTFNVIQNPPNYAVVSLFAGVDLPTIPISVDNSGPLAGNSGTKKLPNVSLRNVDSNIRTAYAHLLSASLEHEFNRGLLASVSYSGSMGEGLYSISNYNPAGSGNVYLSDACTPGTTPGDPGNCTSRLRQTQYSNINRRANGGISNYNSFIGRVLMRDIGGTGLTLDANYTWSHAIDNLSSTFSSAASGNYVLGFLDPFAPLLDRGNADFDIHNRVAISGIYDIPLFKGNSLRDRILGGWELAPIFTAHTGSPFTLFDCGQAYNFCPRAFINGVAPRSGVTNLATPGVPDNYQFYNLSNLQLASYVNPKANISDFGPFPANMVARNSVFGPGSWNLDMGVYKNTKLTERFSLQLRFEAYNLFNHANFLVNSVDVDTSAFNFVDGYFNGNRNVQLGAKLIF